MMMTMTSDGLFDYRRSIVVNEGWRINWDAHNCSAKERDVDRTITYQHILCTCSTHTGGVFSYIVEMMEVPIIYSQSSVNR